MGLYIGIEIGGTKLQLVAADASGDIIKRKKLLVDRSKGAEGIREQIRQGLLELDAKHCEAVGVGFGGPVNWKTGKICRSHHIEGWSEFDLGKWLSEVTGAPAIIDNDANVGALGEAMRGAGVGFNPVFYVTLGSGVGGGLVVDGQIYHGILPGEAELGHVRLDRNGATVESRCSGWAADAKVRVASAQNPSSLLARLVKGEKGNEAIHLAEGLRKGDTDSKRILGEISEDLALGLSHAVHLFHPEIVVLGGGLSGLGNSLRDAVALRLADFTMEAFRPGPKISIATLGEDAVPVGAVELASHTVFK